MPCLQNRLLSKNVSLLKNVLLYGLGKALGQLKPL